ncbi:glycine zipper 2TM domain-containing protein [Methylobacillus arboreus]|uniref:glycine zipper 2TM domain-containing protein n=1 Tax=Methylobacillus arboreus TaxID=755170 RepID=UPI001E55C770|nr:glycine zipper 2TM domain-containing protein [Methylobacillus arboreus]MCB5191252.1 glycine zipper 2TM domain-containing protein [Methylobacillus arboreus]
MRITTLVAAASILLTLSGCMGSKSGDVYSRDEARKTQTVRLGVVESVRNVKLEGTKTPIGGGAGAVVGGIAGSSVGGGKGQAIATVLGALVGGLAGAAAEEGVTRKDGLEITVKLESGSLIAVVQEADTQFSPGDQVRLVESGGVTRVTH